MNATFKAIALGLSLSLTAAPVFAAKIGGNATQTVEAKNLINLGMGQNVLARQSIATVHGDSEVGGDLTQKVTAKNIINLGMGKDVRACQDIASIGTPNCK